MGMDDDIITYLSANWHNDCPVIGTVNLSTGHDFSGLGNHDFKLSYDGGATAVITLDANCATLAAIVSEVQAKINASTIGSGIITVSFSTNYLTLTCAIDHYFTLTAGDTADALVVLGFTAGTYHSEIPKPQFFTVPRKPVSKEVGHCYIQTLESYPAVPLDLGGNSYTYHFNVLIIINAASEADIERYKDELLRLMPLWVKSLSQAWYISDTHMTLNNMKVWSLNNAINFNQIKSR